MNSFLANARAALLAERTPGGFWVGELSPSALSTATAIFTFRLTQNLEYEGLIRAGAAWLVQTQNSDGGWGDTPVSFSNLSTTCLGWAALGRDQPFSSARAEVPLAADWQRDQLKVVAFVQELRGRTILASASVSLQNTRR